MSASYAKFFSSVLHSDAGVLSKSANSTNKAKTWLTTFPFDSQ